MEHEKGASTNGSEGGVKMALSRNEASLAQGIVKEFDVFARSRLLHKRDHQRKMPLWLFLIATLRADHKQVCLRWKNCEKYEFLVKDKNLLAKLWGLFKGNPAMDYSKLTRALRYYYKKDLIEKAADQPYTYKFILSEKTLRYLPTQGELAQYIPEETSDYTNQRTKSLPDFLSVFSPLCSNEQQSESGSTPSSTESSVPTPEMPRGVIRERTDSLPLNLNVRRQNSDGSSWITSTDSGSEAPLSPFDDLKENPWSDSLDEFLFGSKKFPQKVPVTACFKAGDMPLLNFQDLLRLDESASDCCSPLTPESSERSYEVEISNDTSFWISRMEENPELKLPLEMEIPSYGEGDLKYVDDMKTEKAIDSDIDMEVV